MKTGLMFTFSNGASIKFYTLFPVVKLENLRSGLAGC